MVCNQVTVPPPTSLQSWGLNLTLHIRDKSLRVSCIPSVRSPTPFRTGSHLVQASLMTELILPPPPRECWGDRPVPSCSEFGILGIEAREAGTLPTAPSPSLVSLAVSLAGTGTV